jgi:hypothetical protein
MECESESESESVWEKEREVKKKFDHFFLWLNLISIVEVTHSFLSREAATE